jgi:leader peptidase (prepilin peptidase)/N-methyltransferase
MQMNPDILLFVLLFALGVLGGSVVNLFISPRYVLIELTGGLLALCCWLAFTGEKAALAEAALPAQSTTAGHLLQANPLFLGPFAPPLAAVLYFCVLALLLAIGIHDADTMTIPNSLNIALALCGVLSIFVGPELAFASRLLGFLIISVPLFLVTLAIPGSFGGGDVKLMAAAGILLGWQATLVAGIIGMILGGTLGVFLLLTRQKSAKGQFAFGPALCLGVAVALFFAPDLIHRYLALL